MGVLNPILLAISKDLELSANGQSLVFSILILAASSGALCAGKVCQLLGIVWVQSCNCCLCVHYQPLRTTWRKSVECLCSWQMRLDC
jgi:hypothetical protein